MASKNIGIVGGGIGGIAAAVALHQLGAEVSVYEKAEQLREVGAGMMLWPNATRVLRELGLLEEVVARSGRNTHFLVRKSTGKILMSIALGQFEVPAVCMRRADLLSILLGALPKECLRMGCEFERLKQLNGKVRLYFKDSQEVEHDAVIGADGIRSRVRAQLFGISDPIYRGYTVWRGLAGYDGHATTPGFNSESWGKGMRFGILNTGHRRFTWYATANILAHHLDSTSDRKRQLQQLFAGWHEPISDFLEATPKNEILKNGARDCAPLKQWGKGLVTLLGDAAHPCTPNLGQGGCMALEDALVLAKSIKSEMSLRAALRRYESRRINRTRHIQQRSLMMGYIGQWQNPIFVTGRHIVTRMLPAKIFERNLRRVYSYQT
ncbi:MAG TPA: FAD-dependent monooxygenase [Candidatus Udaeobacter sp.]|jgi:2-polyprenyl-6-methoxyphenol hydroxylase-like FAD-dependent oxidoreductase